MFQRVVQQNLVFLTFIWIDNIIVIGFLNLSSKQFDNNPLITTQFYNNFGMICHKTNLHFQTNSRSIRSVDLKI